MKLLSWLLGSVRVSKEMKPSASEGGNFVETKSTKREDEFQGAAVDVKTVLADLSTMSIVVK